MTFLTVNNQAYYSPLCSGFHFLFKVDKRPVGITGRGGELNVYNRLGVLKERKREPGLILTDNRYAYIPVRLIKMDKANNISL